VWLTFSRGSLVKGRSVSVRRRTGWFDGPGGQSVASFTSGSTRLLGSGTIAGTDGLTIGRIRGFAQITLDTAGTSADGYVGALGFCIVSENAFGVGITAIPHPVTDAEWDGWMWHQFWRVSGGLGTGDFSGVHNIIIDCKAKRKIPEPNVLVAVVETSEIGTATMSIFLDTRLLAYLA